MHCITAASVPTPSQFSVAQSDDTLVPIADDTAAELGPPLPPLPRDHLRLLLALHGAGLIFLLCYCKRRGVCGGPCSVEGMVLHHKGVKSTDG